MQSVWQELQTSLSLHPLFETRLIRNVAHKFFKLLRIEKSPKKFWCEL
jgi:hypothetical protein